MNFASWFAKKFRALRLAEGMTQNEFAEVSNIGIATIERIERGGTVPSMSTCLLIAKALGVRLSDLFDGFL